MYNVYITGHFFLMVLWLAGALYSDISFLRGSKKASPAELAQFLKKLLSISNKTEMVASFFLPLLGVLMIVERTFWLTIGIIHIKITLAIIALGLYHISRGVLKKIIKAIEENADTNRMMKKYFVLRLATLTILLIIILTMFKYKSGFTTINTILRLF